MKTKKKLKKIESTVIAIIFAIIGAGYARIGLSQMPGWCTVVVAMLAIIAAFVYIWRMYLKYKTKLQKRIGEVLTSDEVLSEH